MTNKNQNDPKKVLGDAIMMLAKGDENVANQIVEIIGNDKELLEQVKTAVGQGSSVEDLANMIATNLSQKQEQQTAAYRLGAKISYLNTLKGKCPEGQELVYARNGCKVCAKKKVEKIKKVEKDKCGKKIKPSKKQLGGVLEMIKAYKESRK